MVKRTVSITIDCDIWEEAGNRLDSRSEFCENQLRLFLELNNDKEDLLLKQIQDKREEIYVLEDKLCAYRKARLNKANDEHILDDAMKTINRIYDNKNVVGKNQIKTIAKHNHVPYDLLLEHCKSLDMDLVNFAEVPKY